MPTAAPKPCTACGVLVRDGSARCPAHKTRAGTYADSRRGSRHQRGYGSAWDQLREQIRRRANGLCEPCLAVGYVHVGHACDHVVSKAEWQRLHGSLAGVDDPSNLQWISRDCHAEKTVIDRMRANGSDVPPWAPRAVAAACPSPAPVAAPAGPATALAAPSPAPVADQAGRQGGGGEKSEGSPSRTDRLVKFSRAGNLGGGGIPDLAGGQG